MVEVFIVVVKIGLFCLFFIKGNTIYWVPVVPFILFPKIVYQTPSSDVLLLGLASLLPASAVSSSSSGLLSGASDAGCWLWDICGPFRGWCWWGCHVTLFARLSESSTGETSPLFHDCGAFPYPACGFPISEAASEERWATVAVGVLEAFVRQLE